MWHKCQETWNLAVILICIIEAHIINAVTRGCTNCMVCIMSMLALKNVALYSFASGLDGHPFAFGQILHMNWSSSDPSSHCSNPSHSSCSLMQNFLSLHLKRKYQLSFKICHDICKIWSNSLLSTVGYSRVAHNKRGCDAAKQSTTRSTKQLYF